MSQQEKNWANGILLLDGACEYTAMELVQLRRMHVAKLEINGEYNGWEFAPNSKSKSQG